MDRTLACGAGNVGSIPTESTDDTRRAQRRAFVHMCSRRNAPARVPIGIERRNMFSSSEENGEACPAQSECRRTLTRGRYGVIAGPTESTNSDITLKRRSRIRPVAGYGSSLGAFKKRLEAFLKDLTRSRRSMDRTVPSEGTNAGSIPARSTNFSVAKIMRDRCVPHSYEDTSSREHTVQKRKTALQGRCFLFRFYLAKLSNQS